MSHLDRNSLTQWLNKLDGAHLECDGMSRCISTVLSKHNVPHVVHQGSLAIDLVGNIPVHYWIELESKELIDLRAQMWLGIRKEVPHGIFRPFSGIRYKSTLQFYPGRFIITEPIFHILTGIALENSVYAMSQQCTQHLMKLTDRLLFDRRGD